MNNGKEMRGWNELPSCVDYYFARAENRSQFDRAEHYGAELEKRQAIERKQKEAFDRWFNLVWCPMIRRWRRLKERGFSPRYIFELRMWEKLAK